MPDSGKPARIKANAVRAGSGFRHSVRVGSHTVTVDEPLRAGGSDAGPDPQELLAASLASCTAITIEMYATRMGWDVGPVEVHVDYTPAERTGTTMFELVVRVPGELSDAQVERLRTIAAKCPVHRTLEGEVAFVQRMERLGVAV